MTNRCVICGAEIPEGKQVCRSCNEVPVKPKEACRFDREAMRNFLRQARKVYKTTFAGGNADKDWKTLTQLRQILIAKSTDRKAIMLGYSLAEACIQLDISDRKIYDILAQVGILPKEES